MPDVKQDIQRVLEDVIAPLVRADGGDVHVVEISPDSVSIHLSGRFAGCPGNTLVTRRIIEPAIVKVAPTARVTVTSGALMPPGASRVRTG